MRPPRSPRISAILLGLVLACLAINVVAVEETQTSPDLDADGQSGYRGTD
jgi:hypothetical protein